MTSYKSLCLLLISLCLVAGLTACSSSSSTPVTTTTTPPPAITVTVATVPASLYVNSTLAISAAVANDPANGGVTWSCAPAGSCGSFSANQSPSGVAVTYTAPSAPGSVTITATSVTNTTVSASAPTMAIDSAPPLQIVISKPAQWSLAVNAVTSIAATVQRDPANGGVTWSCTPASACGSFSPTQTANTASTSYTAPATPGTVVITASSVTDDALSASTTVNVGSSPLLADGNYVFTLYGEDNDDAEDDPFFAAGVFAVKGGAITGGEQDWGDFFTAASDQINSVGSSISTTADGNLQIILQTCDGSDCTSTDASLGENGSETLNETPVSASHGLINEFDGFASASGTIDLQTSVAPPSGAYAYFVAGDQGTTSVNIAGVINVDSPGTISGTGSEFDLNFGASGTAFQDETFATSEVSPPDSFGRLLFKLNPTNFSQMIYAGYIVDSSHIRLVEVADTYNAFVVGTAFAQATPGTFTTSSVSGNSYVIQLLGFDDVDNFQVAGLLTANANGTIGGAINYNDFTGTSVQSPSPVIGGTYTVDPTGRVTMTGITDGIITLNLQLYLDGNGNAAITSMDPTDVMGGPGYQQNGGGSFTAGSFSGNYALNVTGQWIPAGTSFFNQSEFDAVGLVAADGVGTFPGFADLNWFNGFFQTSNDAPVDLNPTPDVTVNGAFTAAASGVFTGTLTGLDVATLGGTNVTTDAFTYYLIDTTRAVAIETDPNQLGLGYFEMQTQP